MRYILSNKLFGLTAFIRSKGIVLFIIILGFVLREYSILKTAAGCKSLVSDCYAR